MAEPVIQAHKISKQYRLGRGSRRRQRTLRETISDTFRAPLTYLKNRAEPAHLEHEILIVDEVLAVGDAGFQKKCLGKMGDVARSGRTVLFVSHNARAVRSLCSRAILLQNGLVHADGPALQVLSQYEREN